MDTKLGNTALVLAILACVSVGLVGFSGSEADITDAKIKSAIHKRLQMDGRVDGQRIDVTVRSGHVTLGGVVETAVEKALAESIVSRTVVGVRSVTNDIMVRPPATEDDAIQKAVEEEIKTVPALETMRVRVTGEENVDTIIVNVNDGIVKLEGAVNTPLQRRAAERAAKTVTGVKGVSNLIKVIAVERPDRKIEQDVSLYLEWSPIVDIDKVDFSVEHGIVTVKGEVEHLRHLLTVEQDLEKIAGVVKVDVSGLKVKRS